MAKHKHAALMLQYAQDWAETDEPWKRWEVTSHRNEWVALFGHPRWKEESEYRRKPRTLTYTITIPERWRTWKPILQQIIATSPANVTEYVENKTDAN